MSYCFILDAKNCFTIAWGKLHYSEGFQNAPVQFGFTSVQVKILDKTKNRELNKLGEMGYNLKNIVCTTMGITDKRTDGWWDIFMI